MAAHDLDGGFCAYAGTGGAFAEDQGDGFGGEGTSKGKIGAGLDGGFVGGSVADESNELGGLEVGDGHEMSGYER